VEYFPGLSLSKNGDDTPQLFLLTSQNPNILTEEIWNEKFPMKSEEFDNPPADTGTETLGPAFEYSPQQSYPVTFLLFATLTDRRVVPGTEKNRRR